QRVGEQLADLSIEIGIPVRQRDRDAQPALAIAVGRLLELGERGAKVDERKAAFVRNMLHLRALAGRDRDDDESLFFSGLAEIHLEKRSGIVSGHGAVDLLRLVDVAESDV